MLQVTASLLAGSGQLLGSPSGRAGLNEDVLHAEIVYDLAQILNLKPTRPLSSVARPRIYGPRGAAGGAND